MAGKSTSESLEARLRTSHMPKRPGVYAFENTANGKMYIGRAKDLRQRTKKHWRKLETDTDECRGLQNAFNFYGPDVWNIKILAFVPIDDLDETETCLINNHRTLNRKYGYNIKPGGSGSYTQRFSKEELKRRSEAAKIRNKSLQFRRQN